MVRHQLCIIIIIIIYESRSLLLKSLIANQSTLEFLVWSDFIIFSLKKKMEIWFLLQFRNLNPVSDQIQNLIKSGIL